MKKQIFDIASNDVTDLIDINETKKIIEQNIFCETCNIKTKNLLKHEMTKTHIKKINKIKN